MKVTVQANTHLEHRLQVGMTKAVTLPLVIDGDVNGPYAIYVCTSAWDPRQPSDQEVQKVARVVADAINSNHQGLKGGRV